MCSIAYGGFNRSKQSHWSSVVKRGAAQCPRPPLPVQGLLDVAARWRKRHPEPVRLHGPSGQRGGQARGLPATTRGTAGDAVTSNVKTPAAYPQLTAPTASKFAIMKVWLFCRSRG